MNNLRQFCAGLILMIALTVPTFAGNIECPGFVEPPQATATEETVTGDIQNGVTSTDPVTELVVSLLTNLLTII